MSALGDFFFEQASKYPDASSEAFVCMDICAACDDFDDDIPQAVKQLEDRLKRWREVSSDPEKSEAMRKYWGHMVTLLEQGIKDLQAHSE